MCWLNRPQCYHTRQRSRAELGECGQAFSQIKRDLRAPYVERIKANDNLTEWIDLWFSETAGQRIGEIRDEMIARRQKRLAKQEAEEAKRVAAQKAEAEKLEARKTEPQRTEEARQDVKELMPEPEGEVLERISDEVEEERS